VLARLAVQVVLRAALTRRGHNSTRTATARSRSAQALLRSRFRQRCSCLAYATANGFRAARHRRRLPSPEQSGPHLRSRERRPEFARISARVSGPPAVPRIMVGVKAILYQIAPPRRDRAASRASAPAPCAGIAATRSIAGEATWSTALQPLAPAALKRCSARGSDSAAPAWRTPLPMDSALRVTAAGCRAPNKAGLIFGAANGGRNSPEFRPE